MRNEHNEPYDCYSLVLRENFESMAQRRRILLELESLLVLIRRNRKFRECEATVCLGQIPGKQRALKRKNSRDLHKVSLPQVEY